MGVTIFREEIFAPTQSVARLGEQNPGHSTLLRDEAVPLNGDDFWHPALPMRLGRPRRLVLQPNPKSLVQPLSTEWCDPYVPASR
jgi:hypothetical protein